MRGTDGPLRGIGPIDFFQTPMAVRATAVMQRAGVGEFSQQPWNGFQGIRFKILESGT
jgi:hypothetical protein